VQRDLIDSVAALGKPFIVVLCNGSPLSFDTAKPNAILEAWYYGQRGGDAVADAILGDFNPAGRLPLTFYRSDSDLPPFEDYSFANRTYLHFKGSPLYAFGHGLSYTTFSYEKFSLSKSSARATDTLTARVTVKNSGTRDGDEVIQLYATAQNPPVPMPLRQLVGFARVSLKSGEIKTIDIALPIERLRRWDEAAKRYTIDPITWTLAASSASDKPLLKTDLRITP
jgi:beta-glucosidase